MLFCVFSGVAASCCDVFVVPSLCCQFVRATRRRNNEAAQQLKNTQNRKHQNNERFNKRTTTTTTIIIKRQTTNSVNVLTLFFALFFCLFRNECPARRERYIESEKVTEKDAWNRIQKRECAQGQQQVWQVRQWQVATEEWKAESGGKRHRERVSQIFQNCR